MAKQFNSLFQRAVEAEHELRQREFFAPSITKGKVQLRIGSVVCTLATSPPDFVGWGIFRTEDFRTAQLVREATLADQRDYLDLFPSVQLIVCQLAGERVLGSAANPGDRRFRIDGAAPVELSREVQLFDQVVCRFDGLRFWFDGLDRRGDPVTPGFLREALQNMTKPIEVSRKGLTAGQRAAYEANFVQRMQPKGGGSDSGPSGFFAFDLDDSHARLSDALSHAGARLIDYLERDDGFRVTYKVGRHTYTSSVNKADLSVQVAGICLSGEDGKFDLKSLVGVLRRSSGNVLRVGDDGMDEEHYFEIHPRPEAN